MEVCPGENIRLEAGTQAWLHHCEQCRTCIHFCPTGAIQAGKKTGKRERYHHPGSRSRNTRDTLRGYTGRYFFFLNERPKNRSLQQRNYSWLNSYG